KTAALPYEGESLRQPADVGEVQHVQIQRVRVGRIERKRFKKEVVGLDKFSAQALHTGQGPICVREIGIRLDCSPRLCLGRRYNLPNFGVRIERVYVSVRDGQKSQGGRIT